MSVVEPIRPQNASAAIEHMGATMRILAEANAAATRRIAEGFAGMMDAVAALLRAAAGMPRAVSVPAPAARARPQRSRAAAPSAPLDLASLASSLAPILAALAPVSAPVLDADSAVGEIHPGHRNVAPTAIRPSGLRGGSVLRRARSVARVLVGRARELVERGGAALRAAYTGGRSVLRRVWAGLVSWWRSGGPAGGPAPGHGGSGRPDRGGHRVPGAPGPRRSGPPRTGRILT